MRLLRAQGTPSTRNGLFVRPRSVVILVCAALAAGCDAPKPEPQVASSSKESTYAVSFSDDLDDISNDFNREQEEARKIFSAYFDYPKPLKDPNAEYLEQIYVRADASGHGWSYVERVRKVEAAGTFFDGDKDTIVQKVAGSAQYAVKQKKTCLDLDVTGSIAHSLPEAYAKQLEKRLREKNDAYSILTRWHDAMPKEDVPLLEDQADDIAYASYLVRIELVEDKVRLARFVAEGEQIPKTADQYIADERAFQAEPGRSDADKKASDARIDAMTKAKGAIDSSVKRAKALQPEMQKQIDKIDKEYGEAFNGLVAKVHKK